jgi:hypothetical protein
MLQVLDFQKQKDAGAAADEIAPELKAELIVSASLLPG